MLRVLIENDYKIAIPEPLRPSLAVGDELLITTDASGRIIVAWRGRARLALVNLADLRRLEQGSLNKAQRLAALEHARAAGERIRAARHAGDVDAVTLLRQLREERSDELVGVR